MSRSKSLGDFDVVTGPAAPSRPVPASLQRPAAPEASPAPEADKLGGGKDRPSRG